MDFRNSSCQIRVSTSPGHKLHPYALRTCLQTHCKKSQRVTRRIVWQLTCQTIVRQYSKMRTFIKKSSLLVFHNIWLDFIQVCFRKSYSAGIAGDFLKTPCKFCQTRMSDTSGAMYYHFSGSEVKFNIFVRQLEQNRTTQIPNFL